MLALVLINVPIAVSLGIVARRRDGRDARRRRRCPTSRIVTYNGATNFPLLAIPLFILAGAIMNASGISRRLIAFASSLFGWIRGGLAHVSIGASLFFAEISGSAVADVAALGSILIPGDEGEGLSGAARRRGHVVGGDARGDHPAVDPDDPLRGDGGDLGRAAVRRRHRARASSAASG